MLSDDFITAVENHNILLVRVLIKNCFLFENTAKDFSEMNSYAYSKIPELYDVHDNEILVSDKSLWTDSYLADQMVKVITNFSHERISLIRSICEERKKTTAIPSAGNSAVGNSSVLKQFTHQQKIGIGVSVAGLAVSVVGTIVSKPIIIVVGGIVLASGIFTYVTGAQEKL